MGETRQGVLLAESRWRIIRNQRLPERLCCVVSRCTTLRAVLKEWCGDCSAGSAGGISGTPAWLFFRCADVRPRSGRVWKGLIEMFRRQGRLPGRFVVACARLEGSSAFALAPQVCVFMFSVDAIRASCVCRMFLLTLVQIRCMDHTA